MEFVEEELLLALFFLEEGKLNPSPLYKAMLYSGTVQDLGRFLVHARCPESLSHQEDSLAILLQLAT